MSDRRHVFLVAGEASGDQHGAHLVAELRRHHPEWRFSGYGGERMRAAGVELRDNLVDRAVMGFVRVIGQLGYLLGVAGRFLEELRTAPPDLLVLIDYPGLNLNLARMARRHGVPVIYYICPQVWAWAPWRLQRIARRSDQLLVIIPFEEPLYASVHPDVHYVGNPVFDRLTELESREPAPAVDERVLALFPGSRRQEVEGALPALLRVADALVGEYPDLEVRVSCQRDELGAGIEAAIADSGVAARLHAADSHTLQRAAYLSLVVSGTATLEQAFFGTPFLVVYPASRRNQRVFRFLGVTPFIALVNLFAGRRVVPEFLFAPDEEGPILAAARELMEGEPRERMLRELAELRASRFHAGASRRAAQRIGEFLAGGGGALRKPPDP